MMFSCEIVRAGSTLAVSSQAAAAQNVSPKSHLASTPVASEKEKVKKEKKKRECICRELCALGADTRVEERRRGTGFNNKQETNRG